MPRASSAFRFEPFLSRFVPPAVATIIAPPLEHVLWLRRLEQGYASLSQDLSPAEFAAHALDMLKVRFEAAGAVADIPAHGPLVIVAKHGSAGTR